MIQPESLFQIFNSLPVPAVVLLPDSPAFTIVHANRAYMDISGRSEEDLLGRSIFEAFPEDQHDTLSQSLQTTINTRISDRIPAQQYTLQLASPGDEVKYWKAVNIPVLTDQRVEYVLHTVQEVTAEILSEQALARAKKANKEKFEALILSVDGILWEADVDTLNFTYISPQVERILGYTPEKWMGEPGFWQKHIVAEDRNQAISYCHEKSIAGEDHRFEYRMNAANGQTVWLQDIVSVIREDGKAKQLRGLMVDVTEVKNAEEVLRKSEEKYKLLFESSPLPKWIYDLDSYQILDVNQTAIDNYGYSREEFLAMTIKNLTPAEDKQGLFDAVYFARKHAQMISKGEHRHIKKDGQIIHVDIQRNIIQFDKGRAALIIASDVTQRVESLKAIEEQNKKLQDIAYIQSHIVRAPLARIMGLANLIKQLQHASPECQELLNHLIEASDEMDHVIRDIVLKTQQSIKPN